MTPPRPERPGAFALDAATAALIGLPAGRLTRAALRRDQLAQLRATVAWARERSPYYRRTLADVEPASLQCLEDLRRLPFTTPQDLCRSDPPLLCVSQDDISHVVTLQTSGTSGAPKRLFFTDADLAATRAFFAAGMSVFTRAGDRVLILFTGERAGSVGRLLGLALADIGAQPHLAPQPQDPAATARLLHALQPDVVAGAPVPVLAAARHAAQQGPLRVRATLLSSDRAGPALRHALGTLWQGEVHDHWGMTETGLGGGVDCAAHAGGHLREAELLVEVVDPDTGAPLPDGAAGEVVLTTLRRRGLPLIRYRSGDLSHIVAGRCACGSPLRRLARVDARLGAGVAVAGGRITQGDLDEALLALPPVVDFAATWQAGRPATLHLAVSLLPGGDHRAALQAALARVPLLAQAQAAGELRLALQLHPDGRLLNVAGKRRIAVDNAAP